MYSFSEVQNYDPDLAKAMADETQRQRDNIELIASENLVSKAVMAAMGAHLQISMRKDIREKDIMVDVSM